VPSGAPLNSSRNNTTTVRVLPVFSLSYLPWPDRGAASSLSRRLGLNQQAAAEVPVVDVAQWAAPTAAPQWSVKDIALHLHAARWRGG
jgi:hypothetical protein